MQTAAENGHPLPGNRAPSEISTVLAAAVYLLHHQRERQAGQRAARCSAELCHAALLRVKIALRYGHGNGQRLAGDESKTQVDDVS